LPFNTALLTPTIQIESLPQKRNTVSAQACSILLGNNYLNFALSDPSYSKIHLVKHYHFGNDAFGKENLKDIISDPLLKKLKHVKIAFDTPKSTLIPDAFFADKQKKDLFELIHDVDKDEALYTQKLNGKTAVFSIPRSTTSLLGSMFRNVRYYDASSCLLNTYPLVGSKDGYTFFVCIKDDCAAMSVYRNKELVLHQSYTDTTPSDITYYIARCMDVYKAEKDEIHIMLHGESDVLQTVKAELSLYFPDVKYCSRIAHLQYPDTITDQPSHYFFNLFSFVTCA